MWLKVSTAYTFRMGPFVDSTDGVTAETALTLAQADFRLSKAGGAFASKNETTSGAHDENGYYTCILNTTDTNTLGSLDINVSEAGALPVFKSFMVVPAQVWDSYFGADTLQVHAVEISNALITAASIAADAITDAKVAADVTIASVTGAVGSVTGAVGSVGAGGITAASFAADAITAAKIAADVTTELQSGLATAAALSAVADTVDAIDGNVGTAGAGLTVLPWNAAWDAEVQSEVDDALVAHNLDHLVKIAVDTNFATTVHADSVIGQLADNGAGFDRTTDSLEAIRDRGDAAWITGAGGDPWATAIPGAYGAGTAGKIIGDNINATVSSRASQASVDDVPTNAELATALGTADDAVLTQIALVKTQTDKLTFTVANVLDSNVQRVNDVVVNGTGALGDEWGP